MSASSLFIYLQRLVCHKQDFAEKITKATGIERKTSLDLLNVKMITITHLNLKILIFLLSHYNPRHVFKCIHCGDQ